LSLVPPVVEPFRAAEPRSGRARGTAQWLILCGYVLGAAALTWRLWADPATHVTVGDPGPADGDLFAWFMRYAATAIAHGKLPSLVTTAMNAPRGISLVWNTSILLPAVALAPVTLLAGPQTSITILVTLSFAGSAASLFLVLRRWQASVTAAALGGALYGFSPALLNSSIDHYNLMFAVLPPLIIDALLRIITGRGNSVRSGAWLGLLTAAQLFTEEEVLAGTALACLVLVAVLAAGRPRLVLSRVRGTLAGLAAGAAVTLLICGRALWVQFFGPLTEHGSPWPATTQFTSTPASFVTPPGDLLFHTRASAAAAASYPTGLWEYLAYLGLPLLAVLLVAAIRFRADLKVRAVAVTFAALELISLGGSTLAFHGLRYPGLLLPWHWMQSLPVISEMIPDRLAILADGLAAGLLAFSLDRARPTPPQASRPRRSFATAVAALALLPLIPLPIPATTVTPTPAGWQAAFARLRLAPGATVLVVPVPTAVLPQAMRWQADTGEPGSLVGGWFIGPNPAGHAAVNSFGPAAKGVWSLDALWAGNPRVHDPSGAQIRADLRYWRPAAVVAVARPGSRLGRFLTGLLGRPAFQVGQVLAWRR
jgi:hypothetical protein